MNRAKIEFYDRAKVTADGKYREVIVKAEANLISERRGFITSATITPVDSSLKFDSAQKKLGVARFIGRQKNLASCFKVIPIREEPEEAPDEE